MFAILATNSAAVIIHPLKSLCPLAKLPEKEMLDQRIFVFEFLIVISY